MTRPAKPDEMKNYRTVSELARFVGVSVRTIERWFVEGKLPPPTRVGEERMKLWSPQQAITVKEYRLSQLPSAKAARSRIT